MRGKARMVGLWIGRFCFTFHKNEANNHSSILESQRKMPAGRSVHALIVTKSTKNLGCSLICVFLAASLVLVVLTLAQLFGQTTNNTSIDSLFSQVQESVIDTAALFEDAPPSSMLQSTRTLSDMYGATVDKYKILGFSDEAYIDRAIRWHRSLTDLGYPSSRVVVGAMTPKTLHLLQQANITTQPCSVPGLPLAQRRPLNRRRSHRVFIMNGHEQKE